MEIKQIKALQILDSRGNPTIKTYLYLSDDSVHTASVPSGASTGTHEAVELRDKNSNFYNGLSVYKAVENIEQIIAPNLIGKNINDLTNHEETLLRIDNTDNKSKLGANAILGVNMALIKASAYANKQSLWQFINNQYFSDLKITPDFPKLMVNIVNGGKHAGWNFDIQEFMVIPSSNLPSKSIKVAAEIFQSLKKLLEKEGMSILVGDEGGFSPNLVSNEEVFNKIIEAATNINYQNVKDFNLAVDCAATEFFKDGAYELKKTGETKTPYQLLEYYFNLQKKYLIKSFEDPFAEDDWTAFSKFTELGNNNGFQVVGDDLFVTNPKRIVVGIDKKSASAVLIKPNQIGSIPETVEAIKLAKKAGFKIAISHRSGETDDSFIADLSYACAADFIKTGSMCRSERLSKYNRLLEIENKLF